MAARRLVRREVERVWGRRALPPPFDSASGSGEPIGEVWFEDPAGDPALLVKYLFTSEKLSIQVHPGDEAARARGFPRGKDEAWLILDAEPGAAIGLGLRRSVSPGELRSAALDGSIEALLDWRPVAAGDLLYSPAGTVHAIGPGLALVEIQQNLDLTYRLYDYGRPRELHLDDAVAVAIPGPYDFRFAPLEIAPGRTLAAAGAAFAVERWTGAAAAPFEAPAGTVLVPLAGRASIDGAMLDPGTVWALEGAVALEGGEGWSGLVAYPGGGPALKASS